MYNLKTELEWLKETFGDVNPIIDESGFLLGFTEKDKKQLSFDFLKSDLKKPSEDGI